MPRAKGTVQPYPWLPVDWSNLQQDGAKHRLGDTPSCWTGLGNWLSNVARTESPGGLVRTDFWARCQTANSVSVGLGLWLCISNKGPGTADAASGTTGLKKHLSDQGSGHMYNLFGLPLKIDSGLLQLWLEAAKRGLSSFWVVGPIFLSFWHLAPLWWNERVWHFFFLSRLQAKWSTSAVSC